MTEKKFFWKKKEKVINLKPRWQTATVHLKTKNNAPLYFMSVLPSKTVALFLTTKYYFQPVKNIQSGLKHVCIFLPSFIFFPCTVKKGCATWLKIFSERQLLLKFRLSKRATKLFWRLLLHVIINVAYLS